MRNLLPCLLIGTILGCQALTGSNDNPDVTTAIQFSVILSKDISADALQSISGFSSISHFTPYSEQKVTLSQNPYTDLVFAVNNKNQPLFASFLTDNGSYIFGHEETATALLTAVVLPFISADGLLAISEAKNLEEFSSLTERLEYLSDNNLSFSEDASFFELLNKISVDLADTFSAKKDYNFPEFNYAISGSELISFSGETKLPFNVEFKDLVKGENTNKKLLVGNSLDSDYQKTIANSISFPISNGAFGLDVQSDQLASKTRVLKTSRDVLLKTFTLLGLHSKNYEANNTLEQSLLELNFPTNISRPEAVQIVQDHLYKNGNLLTDYVYEQLGFSTHKKSDFEIFFKSFQSLIYNQNKNAPLFNDDSFYGEFNAFEDFETSDTICFENSKEVACKVDVRKITYSIGQSGCRKGEYMIKFGSGFYAPFGLDRGSKIKIDWEFGPSGKTGFWLMPIKDGKTRVNGRTKTVGCFSFGSKKELTLSITLSDHEYRISNTSHVIIEKPKSPSTPLKPNTTDLEGVRILE
ncbi:MAG: hypothetical protein ABJ387_14135 [Balneola sp.]|jgi:hypothetical protein|uniref:hypothetical protein n=1 Tax=Balneola sp. EhC07 TaxID=1849360 RepID=UPI0007F3F799|nr:hypothetical protein [Balneola sp. EhC07]OAN64649.1 hypothetical protein A8B79_00445 [Balneola sp. EhC07]